MRGLILRTKGTLALRMGALTNDKGLPREGERDESTGRGNEAQRGVELAVEGSLKDAESVVRDVDK